MLSVWLNLGLSGYLHLQFSAHTLTVETTSYAEKQKNTVKSKQPRICSRGHTANQY